MQNNVRFSLVYKGQYVFRGINKVNSFGRLLAYDYNHGPQPYLIFGLVFAAPRRVASLEPLSVTVQAPSPLASHETNLLGTKLGLSEWTRSYFFAFHFYVIRYGSIDFVFIFRCHTLRFILSHSTNFLALYPMSPDPDSACAHYILEKDLIFHQMGLWFRGIIPASHYSD